ncbi:MULTISPECIES: DUF5954 family protein [unclassified Solwaraspora]|uniref:DUF5954 family protein n=1 Tax=unclassified Solwaraspora TaxID=2627926 RepID=UPI00259B8225|nr:DUF5954 family protein [Solwaraspora sp. WMMA2056]WJK42364.1 DUF5954 family protein [Solwaraspora sp. WMMA2056]
MSFDANQVPPHLLIKVEQPDHPVSLVAEDDARQRSAAYPTIMWGAPVFGCAQEVDGRWRIVRLNGDSPQDARDSLASHLRWLHSETPPTAGNAARRAEYEAMYELLDWEAVDESTVDGHRYRIIRAQPFIRMGADGPEPPRPTDLDPLGQAKRDTSHMEGFVIDPAAGTGLTAGLVRMELISSSYDPTTVAADVFADSRRALTTHPNVVLLPVGFTVGAYVDGSWRPRSASTYATPQAARDAGSFVMPDIRPGGDTSVEEFRAAFDRARAQHRPPRTDDFEVEGVRCRVTRVETFVRVGPDGPEGPRPSDPESHLPPARLMQDHHAEEQEDLTSGPD